MVLSLDEIPQAYQDVTERFITARAARIAAHKDEETKQQAYFDAQDVSRKADDEFTAAKTAILAIIEQASATTEPETTTTATSSETSSEASPAPLAAAVRH
jgi:hypothetical protein